MTRAWLIVFGCILASAAGAGGGPAVARDAKAEVLDSAQALVTRSALSCTVVDAARIMPEPAAGGGRRHGGGMGGGMSGGGMGGGSGGGMSGQGSGRGAGGDSSATQRDRSGPIGYEVACKDGVGFILMNSAQGHGAGHHDRRNKPPEDQPAPAAAAYLNCLEAKEAADRTNASLSCRLKANRDQAKSIQAVVTHSGVDCAVSRMRGLGHTETQSFFELACAKVANQEAAKPSDTGYVLITGRAVRANEPAAVFSCFDTQANPNLRCNLTNVGKTVEALHRFIVKSDPGCVPADQRLVGISNAGGRVFEIACHDGSGYMLRMADNGVMDPPVACADPALAGKCRLRREATKS